MKAGKEADGKKNRAAEKGERQEVGGTADTRQEAECADTGA